MKITLTLTDCTLEEAQAVLSFNRAPNAVVESEPVEDVPSFEDIEQQLEEDEIFDYPDDTLEEVLQEEVDANGHVWDPALHSSSKAKTNKGFWKMRRGNTTEKADVAILTPPAPPVPTPPPVHIQTMSMANVVEKITAGITSQSISITDVSAALVDLKLANLVDLGARPDLFEPFLKRLGL